jgi:hypothetical protein
MVLSRAFGVSEAGEALALPGSRTSEFAAKQLPPSAEVMMRSAYAALEDLILTAIEKRSASEFKAVRAAVYPTYCRATLALPQLVRVIVPPHVIERLNREFLCELESDLREHGLAFFGGAVRDQAMFTAWTLRKIIDLTTQIPDTATVDQAQLPALADITAEFVQNAIWMRFHLHCLVSSMRSNKAIFPEPLELILDGLRSAVNAYGLARRALDLLVPQAPGNIEPQEWDDEDVALLAEATRDMSMEIVEEWR